VDQGLLREIERFVNDAILRNIPVNTHIMSKKEAMETGAMAIFEEKYGEVVRVVEIGDVSKELCGGTHVRSTGEIGLFKILNESGIASNVRRIEALAGDRALGYVHEQEDLIRSLTERLKVGANDLPKKLDSLIREQKELQKEIERLNQRLVSKSKEELLGGLREIKGIRVISRVVDANSPKQLRGMGDHLKAELKSGVIVLGATSDDKAMLLCNVTQDLVGKIKAGQIIQELSKVVGGSGGGRPDMAQGGGPKKESLGEAIQMAYGLIDKLLG
jgi:alanyl-tRNA synthetase